MDGCTSVAGLFHDQRTVLRCNCGICIMHCFSWATLSCLSWFPLPAIGIITNKGPFLLLTNLTHQAINQFWIRKLLAWQVAFSCTCIGLSTYHDSNAVVVAFMKMLNYVCFYVGCHSKLWKPKSLPTSVVWSSWEWLASPMGTRQ